LRLSRFLRVFRRCPRCGDVRPFVSSGKFRVNASGRRLDVWLVHRCADCDETWNASLHERTAPERLPHLDAYHGNDADLARRCAFAVPGADRRVAYTVERRGEGRLVQLTLADPVDVRVDRLLAGELGLSRAQAARYPRVRVSDGLVIEV
jgi:hypothetical protein